MRSADPGLRTFRCGVLNQAKAARYPEQQVSGIPHALRTRFVRKPSKSDPDQLHENLGRGSQHGLVRAAEPAGPLARCAASST